MSDLEENCLLCGQPGKLHESHLYPKFVVRWLQRTGGRYFRNPTRPNQRMQDGPKHHLLCLACEQKFSVREKWFSERIFFPYINDRQFRFEYDSSLYFFSISLLWRTLESYLRLGHDPELAPWVPTLRDVEAEWRTYLATGVLPPKYPGVHIFIADVGLKNSPVHGANMYFGRALDGEVYGNTTRCQVFSKLPRFFFFGEVTSMLQEENHGTRINPEGGILQVPQTLADRAVGTYLTERIAEFQTRMKQISERQHEIIGQQLRKDATKIYGSDLFHAHVADRELEVDPVLPKSVGRNDRCPCGSGAKFKLCHGGR